MAALEADVRDAEVVNHEAIADLEKARLEVSVSLLSVSNINKEVKRCTGSARIKMKLAYARGEPSWSQVDSESREGMCGSMGQRGQE